MNSIPCKGIPWLSKQLPCVNSNYLLQILRRKTNLPLSLWFQYLMHAWLTNWNPVVEIESVLKAQNNLLNFSADAERKILIMEPVYM